MAALLFLLVVAILFSLSVAAKPLLWAALILLVLWLAGWVVRPGGGRWYYW